MADIFLSYAHEDVTKAKQLAEALEKQGWSVFWDRTGLLAGQDFEAVIEQEIDQARCMIVAWSEPSRKSDWVRGEAQIGREQKKLVPVLFDSIMPPIAFRAIHTEDFSTWNGEPISKEFDRLQRAVARLAPNTSGSVKASADANDKIRISASTKPIDKIVTPKTIIESEMIVIPSGSFNMGSDTGYSNEIPVHRVWLRSFLIGQHPVTFDLYDQFTDALGMPRVKDEGWGRGSRPVINVNWEDAVTYAGWVSQQTGKQFRLPSEAEWEYAARASTTGDYYWGQDEAKEFAWFKENSDERTQPVGQLKPNTFGLYDMSGNIWEWVHDYWHDNYDNAPDNGSYWETGNGTRRVLRGGSWGGELYGLRSALRTRSTQATRHYNIGFRLAQDLP